MLLNCSSLVFSVPYALGQTRITNTTKLTSTTHVGSCFLTHRKKTNQNKSFHIVSQLKFNQNYFSSSVMEDQRNILLSSPGLEKYSKELDVAVRAVQMACSLCQKVQDSLISTTNSLVHSKDDNSPVTMAVEPEIPVKLRSSLQAHLMLEISNLHTRSVVYGCNSLSIVLDHFSTIPKTLSCALSEVIYCSHSSFSDILNFSYSGTIGHLSNSWSVQAMISWILSESFGCRNVSILAEEDVESLSTADATGLLDAVVKTVNGCLTEAPYFGLMGPETPLESSDVLEAISRCNSTGGPTGRFWAIDPVDSTLGFVRGDQYAVALALIEDGEVVLGVLGCPNYPMKKEWLSYHHRYQRIISKLIPPTSESWDKGCVIYARKGSGEAWMQPVHQKNKLLAGPNSAIPVRVSSIDNPALATFCEPVEKSNSSHSFTAGLAHCVGLRKQPLCVYSMVKYAAIARGDAEIFMKFARTGYKEKIWDHAAGVIIIQEAGGVVTDAGGSPLDFSKGICLEGLDRGIIASAGAKLHEKIISAVDASWNSSCL